MSDINSARPLWKRSSTGETARKGAEFIAPKATTLRQAVLDEIEAGEGTPEQIH